MAIVAARQAFADQLLQLAPEEDVVGLAMAAYSQSFTDMIIAAAGSRQAAVLIEAANRLLMPAGYRLVPLRR